MAWYSKYTMTQIEQAIENALSGGAPSASLIHQASVTLNDAQIKAIPSRIQVVGNPAADVFLSLVSGSMIVSAFAAGYTAGSLQEPIMMWGDGTIAAWYFGQDGILLAGAHAEREQAPMIPISALSFAGSGGLTNRNVARTNSFDSLVGQGFQLRDDNNDGGADYTGGDSANTVILACIFLAQNASTGAYLTTVESGWDEDTRTFS